MLAAVPIGVNADLIGVKGEAARSLCVSLVGLTGK